MFGYRLYQQNPALFQDRLDLINLYHRREAKDVLELVSHELDLEHLDCSFPHYVLDILIAFPQKIERILPYNAELERRSEYHHRLPASLFPGQADNPFNIVEINLGLHALIHLSLKAAYGTTCDNAGFGILGKAWASIQNDSAYLDSLHILEQPIFTGQPLDFSELHFPGVEED